MNDTTFLIFDLIVVLFSVVIHEVSHGFIAERLGDPTARLAGRLTLNPISHIDPVGTILVPLVLHFSGAPIFGWARPVPYNPMNLRDPVGGGAKIAAAGPLSNFFVAAVFGILIRLLAAGGNAESPLVLLFSLIVLRNIALGVFNLLPIPPLDGSKVLFAILPRTPAGNQIAVFLEQYGFMLLLFFVFSGFTSVLSPAIIYIFEALVGRGL
jgi:Zn-dependent protease